MGYIVTTNNNIIKVDIPREKIFNLITSVDGVKSGVITVNEVYTTVSSSGGSDTVKEEYQLNDILINNIVRYY